MSGINGDKARFNRRRRQKIHLRARQRVMFGSLPKQADLAVPPSQTKSKEKLA
jgi:hypothetical protein